jgi:hypothetical protein
MAARGRFAGRAGQNSQGGATMPAIRRRGVRAAAGAAGAVVAILLPATTLADPINGAHRAVFPLACSGQEYLVAGGAGAAAQVVDGTAVLVPAAFVQVSRRVDPATGEVVTQTDAFGIGNGKRTGQQEDLVACTYHARFGDPEVGTVTVDGTVTAFLAPRG